MSRAPYALIVLLCALSVGQFAYIIRAESVQAEIVRSEKDRTSAAQRVHEKTQAELALIGKKLTDMTRASASGVVDPSGAQIQLLPVFMETLQAELRSAFLNQAALSAGPAQRPIITGIIWPPIAGRSVKALDVSLNMNVDVMHVMSLGGVSTWDRKALMPIPWPPTYVNIFRQEFNPYTFAVNASVLRASKGKVATEDLRKPAEYLLQQLARYSKDDVVFYDFDYEISAGVLPAGWTSALANGMAALGLLDLSIALDDASLRSRAKRYLDKVLWKGQDTDLSMVDESSYLWFEETPPLGGRRTHIINGHISVVFALYRYMQVTGDRTYEPHVKAGLATAARYFWETRRPGDVPTYWLFDDTKDYGPLRAINFADTLAAMSAHPTFVELADALRTDAPIR